MTAAVYLRKSRADEGDPDALHRHRETLLAFAQEHQMAVAEIFEEIVSGESLYLRPQMLRLLEGVQEGRFEAVLCMDIDRLGRGDMASQGIILDSFRSAACKIVTPRRVYDLSNEMDETYSEFEAFMARQEYKMIVRRMRRGVMAAAREGAHVTEVPFGYVRAWEGKRPTLALHPEEASWVQTAFSLYTGQGQGCQKIADLFNAAQVPAKKSAQWSRTSIRKMLHNPVYTGTWLYNRSKWQKRKKPEDKNKSIPRPPEEWICMENAFPAIVSKEQFQLTQELFQSRSHSPSHAGRRKNPLAGLVYCGLCGAKMQRQHQESKSIAPCLRCPTRGCSPSVPLEQVEQAVLLALTHHLAGLQTAGALAEPKEGVLIGAAESLEKELVRLESQKARLHDFLEREIYTPEVFAQRRSILEAREKEIKEQLGQLCQREEKKEAPSGASVLEGYAALDAEQKNQLLKTLIRRIDLIRPSPVSSRSFSISITLRGF